MTQAPASKAYAYGHLDVTVAIIAPPAAEVRAWLPQGLSLAPQTMTPPGTHPVTLMFGEHSHVRPWFMPPSAGGSYGEWIVATPALDWTDDGGHGTSWAYMSRLFLSSPWFVFLGWLYAYPKVLARVSAPPGAYTVGMLLGAKPRVEMWLRFRMWMWCAGVMLLALHGCATNRESASVAVDTDIAKLTSRS